MSLQHIKDQYDALKPILYALVAAYPAHFEAAWFTWEAYLWAVQLWYAYAMQVSCCHVLLQAKMYTHIAHASCASCTPHDHNLNHNCL